MKVIAINGSPRKSGNTATLLQEALAGAAAKGAETELINLYDLDYKGCTSCFYCKRKDRPHAKCAMKDDLSPILERMEKADALIFGTPIYFMNISAGLAALLERFLFCHTIYSAEQPTLFPKEIASAFIYTMNVTANQAQALGLELRLKSYEDYAQRFFRKAPLRLAAYDTYQFSDYDKYESSLFSEPQKAKQRAEQFPRDREEAYRIGTSLACGGER